MNHFLTLSELTKLQIEHLVERAFSFKHQNVHPTYAQSTLANLFYEPSTRTRVSFELAAHRLSMSVINLDIHTSSEIKGEQLLDTIQNLAAMGVQYFVIRHTREGIQQELAQKIDSNLVHLINAGDGTHAHPSQAILDIMTIIEQKPRLEQLKVVLIGNIKHSRVAHSFEVLCSKLGIGELVQIAPTIWQPQKIEYGRVTDNLTEGLAGADVVICLRVQQERLAKTEFLDKELYKRDFSLTEKKLALAKPDVMVMHPGPINRGMEIDSEVADGKHSFILQQVTNGVYARMAIIDSLKNNHSKSM